MEEKFREIWKKVPRDFGKSSERFLGKVQVLFLFRLNAFVSGGDNVFQSVTQCLHKQGIEAHLTENSLSDWYGMCYSLANGTSPVRTPSCL